VYGVVVGCYTSCFEPMKGVAGMRIGRHFRMEAHSGFRCLNRPMACLSKFVNYRGLNQNVLNCYAGGGTLSSADGITTW
jgi:hypothetical protein